MEGQDLRKQVAKGISIVFIFQILSRFFNFFFKAFLQRFLTPVDFGIIAITDDLINLVNHFGNFGLDQTVTVIRGEETKILATSYRIRIFIGFVIYFVIFIVAPYWAAYFAVPESEWTIRLLGLNVLISAFGFAHLFYFIRNVKFNYVEIINFIGLIGNITCAVILVFLGFKYWSVFCGAIACVLIVSILSIILCPLKIGIKFDKTIAKEIVKLGKFFLLAGVLTLLIHSIGNWVILKEKGTYELGIFAVAVFWSNRVPIDILGMVLKVITPAFAIVSKDIERVRSGYVDCIKILSVIILPMSLGFVLISEKFVKVVIGAQWISVVTPLIILNVYGMLRAFSSLNGTILGAIGKPNLPSYTGIIHLIILLCSLLFVTKKYGVVGASFVILACGLVANIILWSFAYYSIRFNLKNALLGILKCLLCCLIMGIFVTLILYLLKNDLLALISSIIVGAIVYFFAIKIILKSDVRLIFDTLKKLM